MSNLLWKIFPPYEVKEARRYVDTFVLDNQNIASDELSRLINLNITGNMKMVVDSIRLEHKNLQHVVLSIIAGVIKTTLSSGKYHIYTGTLSLIGQNLQSSFYTALEVMLEKNFIDKELSNKLKSDLENEIKQVG